MESIVYVDAVRMSAIDPIVCMRSYLEDGDVPVLLVHGRMRHEDREGLFMLVDDGFLYELVADQPATLVGEVNERVASRLVNGV